MKICLQDPNLKDYNLHEEILLASISAINGAGVFAFATRGGISLLLADDFFVEYIATSTFLLIVGTDEITNTQSIEVLRQYTDQFPNLTVKAFLNNEHNATFHPKYCWFRQKKGGSVIVGSGNLTQQGLRRNWEAFSVLDLDNTEIKQFETQWNHWFVSNQKYIRDLDDPLIIERVKLNVRRFGPNKVLTQAAPEVIPPEAELPLSVHDEDFGAWTFGPEATVLIAEIPRGSTRWNQANFDKATFIDFFGATPGDNTMRILFRGINEDGTLHDDEIRQSISVKSHNWRFELDLAKGKAYPDEKRPIGLFVKTSKRNFLYMLKMPEDKYYSKIVDILNANHPEGIRRLQFTANDLVDFSADLPLWTYLVKDAV